MITFEPLRKMMEEQNISTYYLRVKCGNDSLGNKTIERLMNDESVSTNTINSLCNIFNCSINDIMDFTPENTVKQL